ncbi:MAG TPA: hypothetical protein VGX92_03150 [Pyrinomonadaceae bacterium]|nr:hypothetical protein [Pyrinomonadaceae bacterium]
MCINLACPLEGALQCALINRREGLAGVDRSVEHLNSSMVGPRGG